MKKNMLCPVCEKHIFVMENDFDICDVCGWENDGVQGADFNYRGGANSLSVNDCKIIYKISLLNDFSDKLSALEQEYRNKNKDIHTKYLNIDWRIDGEKIRHELSNAVDEYMEKIYELYRLIK